MVGDFYRLYTESVGDSGYIPYNKLKSTVDRDHHGKEEVQQEGCCNSATTSR